MNLHSQWPRLDSSNRLYGLPYPIIGITGGVASGKSSLRNYLHLRGVPTLSADELVKCIYQKASTDSWMRQHLPDFVAPNGIDFKKLRAHAFQSPDLRQRLESFLYPLIPDVFKDEAAKLGDIKVLVYEVPLLYERKLEKYFDVVCVSWASRETQKSRLIQRDHLSDELAERMLNQQWPIDEKRKHADLVFDNSLSRSESELHRELEVIWNQLFE